MLGSEQAERLCFYPDKIKFLLTYLLTSMNNKNQHVRSQTDIQTCMHALNHSRSHIHIRECVRSVCVYVCVRSVCVHVCGCARVIVLYCKRVLEYACV